MGLEIHALKAALKKADRPRAACPLSEGRTVSGEIHIEETPHSAFQDYTLFGKDGEIVPRLVEDRL